SIYFKYFFHRRHPVTCFFFYFSFNTFFRTFITYFTCTRFDKHPGFVSGNKGGKPELLRKNHPFLFIIVKQNSYCISNIIYFTCLLFTGSIFLLAFKSYLL